MGFIKAFTTTAKNADAGRIVDVLVCERLAACVQVIGQCEPYNEIKLR